MILGSEGTENPIEETRKFRNRSNWENLFSDRGGF